MEIESGDEPLSLYHVGTAAALLNESLPGKSESYWTTWLQNNRSVGRRVPYRIPFRRGSGSVFYLLQDLQEFVEWEKTRQLGTTKLSGRAAEAMRAFGVGEATGSTTGRKLDYEVFPQFDPVTGEGYVQLIVKQPLMVFRLSLTEAEDFAENVTSATSAAAQRK